MTFDAKKIIARLVEAGEEWADKEAAASLLEETKSSILAHLTNIQVQQGAESFAKAEALAKATDSYKDHIAKMVEARREANRARVRWISGQAHVELMRSEEASKRAGLKAIGM